MTFIPSKEQAAFLHAVETTTGSIVLTAVAGSGKTTTILEAAERSAGDCAILAYNSKIAKEIKEKLERRGVDWRKAIAGTVHSFGFKAYRKAFPSATVDENKVARLADTLITSVQDESGKDADLGPYLPLVCRLVGYAKQSCIGVTRSDSVGVWDRMIAHFDLDFGAVPSLAAIGHARQLLAASVEETDRIDFEDMIYMPLVLNLRMAWTYSTVFLDEAQDTNDARRELCKRLIKPGGRLIAVGDPHQAIYGFTGADNDSLDIIQRQFDARVMPLSVTFRCPANVVAFAQKWVDHIHAAPGALPGVVGRTTFEQLLSKPENHAHTAILCRNVAPMIAAAFALIRADVSCRVEGRDIGKNLLKIVNRWKVRTLNALDERLEKFEAAERSKLLDKKASDAKIQAHEDKFDTIRVLIEACRARGETTVEDLRNAIEKLFSDNVTGCLVLSTVHKSKGREWDHVVMLDREELYRRACQRSARTPWQVQQEHNLCYVAATRALASFHDITSESFGIAPRVVRMPPGETAGGSSAEAEASALVDEMEAA